MQVFIRVSSTKELLLNNFAKMKKINSFEFDMFNLPIYRNNNNMLSIVPQSGVQGSQDIHRPYSLGGKKVVFNRSLVQRQGQCNSK